MDMSPIKFLEQSKRKSSFHGCKTLLHKSKGRGRRMCSFFRI